MPLSKGDKLGPYELLAPIGAGGMGEVYMARDTRLDRSVAIKVSKTEFSERFEREARAVAALNHPHICQLYDVGPNYLVMEFIEGTPLKGPLPLDLALKYAAQICDALDAAHKKGITHRDLKPANILVTKQGIKLLDFGLAKIVPLGGAQPIWRRDGSELFYLSTDDKIVAVPIKLGASFEPGVPHELFPVQTPAIPHFRREYSVSPDGERFLVIQRVPEHVQTILLQNWLSPAR